MVNNQISESMYKKSFWYADWSFPILVALLSAGIFSGTHMYYVYKVGAFNEVAIVALLEAGIQGSGYGAAAAFGASFLFARVLEGGLVGVLDIGGSLMTGVGIGIPALFLGAGLTLPIENFFVSLVTGLLIGAVIGAVVIGIKRVTVGQANSTFGSDVMMGAGNSSGRFLGPLIIISAASASIPIGLGSIIGGALFYLWNKPVAGGAILGAMALGAFFPL